MNEWEIFLTDEVEEFLDALYETDPQTHKLVNQAILVLERNGPAEGRPLVDTVSGSKIPNLKELRPVSSGRSELASCSPSIRGGRPSCLSLATRQATGEAGIRRQFYGLSVSTRST